MGGYQVRGYYKTGFDGVNIPDSLALLNQFRYKDFGEILVAQERGLTEIRLPGTWLEVSDIDYLKVGTDSNAVYYSCVPTMVADDVVSFTCIPDYILSAGGIQKATQSIIGGLTSRVIPRDDTIGAYEESDALLSPSLPLQVRQKWKNPGGTDNYTFVETTLDLPRTYATNEATTCISSDGEKVTYPNVSYIKQNTSYKLNGINASNNPVTLLYDLNDTTVGDLVNRTLITAGQTVRFGIAKARTLGIENAISQHQIPKGYVTPSFSKATAIKNDNSVSQYCTSRYINTMTGRKGTISSELPFNYTGQSNSVVWGRILTSEYTKYGILTASGESCEYNPGDILQSGNAPSIDWLADPRPDGKPYFRFHTLNGEQGTGALFFRASVSGLTWKKVQQLFTETSGSALNTLNYESSRRIADSNYRSQVEPMQLDVDLYTDAMNNSYQRNKKKRSLNANMLKSATFNNDMIQAGLVNNMHRNNMRKIDNGFEWLMGERPIQNLGLYDGTDMQMSALDYDIYKMNQPLNALKEAYKIQKENELASLAISNNVSVPTVTIPYNSDVIRDFYGNGFIVYRYTYNLADVARINKILTMFGYKHTRPVESSDFTNRKNFNYVECSGVSVTGFNKTFNDGIAAQLNNGVRVWHVKPDKRYYENKAQNPLR